MKDITDIQTNINRLSEICQRQFEPMQEVAKALEVHRRQFEPMQEAFKLFSDRYQEQFDSIQKAMKISNSSIQPLTKFQKDTQSLLEPFRKQQQIFRRIMVETILPNYQFPDFSRTIKQINILSPTVENLLRSYENLSPAIKEALMLLAEHCWYFDFNMPITMFWELKKSILQEDIAKVEPVLIGHFEWRLDEIEASLITQFPHRVDSIRSVFESHRCGNYDASITQFFALIDGICKEGFGGYLFIRKNGKPETAQYVEQITTGNYMSALLIPLTRITSINKSKSERGENFNQLNRHVVMHGMPHDHSTKAKSLKAVSLINYVSYIVKIYSQASQKRH